MFLHNQNVMTYNHDFYWIVSIVCCWMVPTGFIHVCLYALQHACKLKMFSIFLSCHHYHFNLSYLATSPHLFLIGHRWHYHQTATMISFLMPFSPSEEGHPTIHFVSDRFHLPGFQSPPDGHLSWSNLLEAEAIYLPLQWLRISVTRIAVPAWTRVHKYISNGYEMATSFPKFTHISTAQHKTNSNSIA